MTDKVVAIAGGASGIGRPPSLLRERAPDGHRRHRYCGRREYRCSRPRSSFTGRNKFVNYNDAFNPVVMCARPPIGKAPVKRCGPCRWQILSLARKRREVLSSASRAILPAALALSCLVTIRCEFLTLSTFTAIGLLRSG